MENSAALRGMSWSGTCGKGPASHVLRKRSYGHEAHSARLTRERVLAGLRVTQALPRLAAPFAGKATLESSHPSSAKAEHRHALAPGSPVPHGSVSTGSTKNQAKTVERSWQSPPRSLHAVATAATLVSLSQTRSRGATPGRRRCWADLLRGVRSPRNSSGVRRRALGSLWGEW